MDDTRDMRRRIITTAVKRALLKDRPELDDAALAGAMIEVIISTQDTSPTSLPLMFCILTELAGRVIKQLPAPTRCDDNGRPLYNVTEAARALGLTDAETDRVRDYLRDKGVQSADPAQTHTLN
ncbi:hypothetical protein [Dentiradicibacter hellwigii]|uniref:Uncharacterized protein n=1 Tax=Dentiradicibacter hellwigii TaxID=3149053 RepID=A0ABV4UCQ6_9RHOO